MKGQKRPLAWLLGLVAFAFVVSACAGVSRPQGWAPPLAEEDTLYVSIERGKMAALDAEDVSAPSVQWIFPPEDSRLRLEAIYGAPAVGEDTVYFSAYDRKVYALDRETGAARWEFRTDEPIIAGVVLSEDGERLYAGSNDHNLYVLNPENGIELARFDAGDEIWATPLLHEGVLYVSTVSGDLFALDAETLEELWDEPFTSSAGLIMDPVLVDGELLAGGIGKRLHSIDIATGRENWSFRGGNWFWGSPIVENGVIYAPNLDGRVYALDMSGNELWSFQSEEGGFRAGPALVDEVLVVVDRRGNVFGVRAEDGVQRWGPYEIEKRVHADAVVIDGQVLIVAQGGDLFLVDDPAAGFTRPLQVAAR